MNKYVKNPIEITAIQYQLDDENISIDEAQDKIADFVGQNIEVVDDVIYLNGVHGQVEVKQGDWVIKQNDNDFYPCSDEVFKQNYKQVPATWYDRIKLELAGEQDKLEKLTATLKEERPSFVDEGQWVLMFSQQFHMRMYVQYLEKRIALADGETVDLVDSAVSHGSESNLT